MSEPESGVWVWLRWGAVLLWAAFCELRIFRAWRTMRETNTAVERISKWETSETWSRMRGDVDALKATSATILAMLKANSHAA